ncbi:hypothetical protein, partial [Escherichia coli]|uniref:hypothetical protein n=1 Tax=Escherichia coli TaxID=562 RepID=UPI001F4B4F4E
KMAQQAVHHVFVACLGASLPRLEFMVVECRGVRQFAVLVASAVVQISVEVQLFVRISAVRRDPRLA